MPTGTLHLVAVPIGNPMTSARVRGIRSRAAAVVAAEDTRHFATLARHHGLSVRAVSYHDHNEAARTSELLGRLSAGDDVALVSDAGTPLVSDPGFRLVRAAIDAGIAVTAIPGPSAVITALVGSGLPPHPFHFIGFLPRAAGATAIGVRARLPASTRRWWPSRRRTVSPRPSATRSPCSGTDRPAWRAT